MKNITRLMHVCFFVFVIYMALSATGASTSGQTAVKTAEVPCYVKIRAGGELRVAIDADRKTELNIKKAADESEVIVTEYRNGEQRKDSQAETVKLDNDEYRKTWKFNIYFEQTPESSRVDEIRITVKEGAAYAEVGQTGDHRIDFYNAGYQWGTTVNPNMSLSVRITGDNQSGGQTSGNLILESETGDGQEKIPFTIEKDQTLKWDYPVEKGVNSVDVDVQEGMAKVTLLQPSDYKAAEPAKAKTVEQKKETSKAATTSGTAKAVKVKTTSSEKDEKSDSGGTILNGSVPLMEGAKVLVDMTMGGMGKADFEVEASPEEVLDFYKKAMVARGWDAPEVNVQGVMGVLKTNKGASAFTILVRGTAQSSVVNIALTTQ